MHFKWGWVEYELGLTTATLAFFQTRIDTFGQRLEFKLGVFELGVLQELTNPRIHANPSTFFMTQVV